MPYRRWYNRNLYKLNGGYQWWNTLDHPCMFTVFERLGFRSLVSNVLFWWLSFVLLVPFDYFFHRLPSPIKKTDWKFRIISILAFWTLEYRAIQGHACNTCVSMVLLYTSSYIIKKGFICRDRMPVFIYRYVGLLHLV